jgi:hypothetical protein
VRSKRIIEVASVSAPHIVLLDGSLVKEYVFRLEHPAFNVSLHEIERAFFERGFLENEFVQVALFHPKWLLLPPNSFELVHLVALVVVDQAVKETKYCARPYAVGLLMADFEKIE